jgi:hypothetical protein
MKRRTTDHSETNEPTVPTLDGGSDLSATQRQHWQDTYRAHPDMYGSHPSKPAIRRVLRPGGTFIYTVRHTGDAHYGAGTPHATICSNTLSTKATCRGDSGESPLSNPSKRHRLRRLSERQQVTRRPFRLSSFSSVTRSIIGCPSMRNIVRRKLQGMSVRLLASW